jgi:hypothetical protein
VLSAAAAGVVLTRLLPGNSQYREIMLISRSASIALLELMMSRCVLPLLLLLLLLQVCC